MPIDADDTRALDSLERRRFLKTGAAAAAVVGLGATACGKRPSPPTSPSAILAGTSDAAIPTRPLGSTGVELPVIGYGGGLLSRAFGNRLSFEDRVELVRYAFDRGLRYFDTGENYQESQAILGRALAPVRGSAFIATKIDETDPARVRASVERCLEELSTDYVDAVLIHGTPGLESMSASRALEVGEAISRLRDEGLTRHVGLSAHGYFDKALALISSGQFDLCMLAYGYFSRGYDQRHSRQSVELRNRCIDAARARGMGVVAMKVLAAGMLGNFARYLVPSFPEQERVPGAAIRYVLRDQRVDNLVLGVRTKGDVDDALALMTRDVDYSSDDEKLLADFSAKLTETPQARRLRIE